MRAVAYTRATPAANASSFAEIDLPQPDPGSRDLIVKVEAVSVNPVDFKLRQGADPGGTPKVLGFDAAGTVAAIGKDVTLFKPGDAVFHAGSILRPGTNSEFHAVDERIVGRKPRNLGMAEAAALPLTALTAWELLFDRIGVSEGEGADRRSLLIVGGAGGVGSIAIQLARALTGLTVIATASRPESEAWVRQLGAHHVVDHAKPLAEQLAAIGIPAPDIVIGLAGTKGHAAEIAAIVAAQGHVGLIEGPDGFAPDDFQALFQKAAALHFELMFVRPRFEPADMVRQHEILGRVADLVEAGRLRTTLTKRLSPIGAATLGEAHALLESGRTIGKIALEGWA